MGRKSRVSKPVRIPAKGASRYLSHVLLNQKHFSEAWLQELIQRHPLVLPVTDIEPGFGELVPIAREVPCSQGIIDNLFVTPEGNIVFAELKLWKNPQARREVIAQCLDYLSAMVSMTYDDFQSACLKGQFFGPKPSSVYELVSDVGGVLEEAAFIDAISRNLKLGRILAIVAGDGVREQAETLSNLLQGHAASQFTLALVELAVYRDGADHIIVPSTLVKTDLVKRFVYVGTNDSTVLDRGFTGTDTGHSTSITEDQFFENMEKRRTGLTAAIRSFLLKLEPLGVYPEWLASLNLFRDDPNGGPPISLGYIQKNGQFYTSSAGKSGRQEIALPYHKGVASLVNGKLRDADPSDNYATVNGMSAPRIEQLLPEKEDELFVLMKEYLDRALE